MSILDIVGSVLKPIRDIVDEVFTSGEEKAQAQKALLEVEAVLQARLLQYEEEVAKARAEVLQAEIQSQSWLARNWRPLLMLVFTYIVLHNFVLTPIFGLNFVVIPQDMWDLLKIGVGGYILGRSAEKGIKEWRNGGK